VRELTTADLQKVAVRPVLTFPVKQASSAPAQRHRLVPPAVDVLGVLAVDLDHGLDGARGRRLVFW